MAVRNPTTTRRGPNGEVLLATWAALALADTGGPLANTEHLSEKSFQLTGTLSAGGACTIEGSNDGGTTWATLKDKQGVAIVMTALGFATTQDKPGLVRPNISAGDGSTLLALVMAAHRADVSAQGGL